LRVIVPRMSFVRRRLKTDFMYFLGESSRNKSSK
jgi:hypothetical protein